MRCEQNQVFEIPVQCLLQQTFPELHSETEVCHSSKPQGRRDLGRGHLPRPVPPSYASVSPFLFLSAPGLLPVLFSPFLPRTTKQGCPSLLLTQGAGEGGSGKTTGRLLQKSSPCDTSGKGLQKCEEQGWGDQERRGPLGRIDGMHQTVLETLHTDFQ